MGCTGSKAAEGTKPEAPVVATAKPIVPKEVEQVSKEPSTPVTEHATEAIKTEAPTPKIVPAEPEPIVDSEGNDVTSLFPEDSLFGRNFVIPEECTEVDLPKNMKYRGSWENAKQHGVGLMTYQDGGEYLGEFKEGKAEGYGIYTAKDKCQYKGAFVEGKAHGYGIYYFTDGSVYYGSFEKDKRHGLGREVQADGLEFVGPYVNGSKCGLGRLFSTSGENYVGEFKDNEIEGFGVYQWPDGRVYEGEWKLSQQHGQAKFTWPDGRIYVGEYSRGKINGKGVLIWPDGRKYDGEWRNGLQEGIGKYYASTGTYRSAQFLEGVRTRWLGEPITEDEEAALPEVPRPPAFVGITAEKANSMGADEKRIGIDAFVIEHAKHTGGLEMLMGKKNLS